ncbi:hypothetical protein DFP95_11237 [Cohnella lupini]|uniref:Uncharacterized protein n=1 Tax=Cohnella lupini TaxID=1294267 RepID=A0A3D9I6E7_9BACL|nr:hypothetical protein DFP95_11237 [Cohnella lupini]
MLGINIFDGNAIILAAPVITGRNGQKHVACRYINWWCLSRGKVSQKWALVIVEKIDYGKAAPMFLEGYA